MNSNIKKVPNNGSYVQERAVVTFLQFGKRNTPEEIWVGKSDEGIEITAPTEEECIAGIERSNRRYATMKKITQPER